MAYKKYIKIGGKLYGPYEYVSYRDDKGDVRTKYIKKSEEKSRDNSQQNINFSHFKLAVFGLIIVLLIISVFYLSEFQTTGKSVLSIEKNTFLINEPVKGLMELNFNEGEFYPADSIIKITFNNKTEEMTLGEFVSLANSDIKKSESDFYIKNSEIQGSGEGYGFSGVKEVPAEVYFKLRLDNIQSAPIEETPTEQPQEQPQQPEETPTEQPQENITEEQQPEETPTEQPQENITEEQQAIQLLQEAKEEKQQEKEEKKE